jgi:Lrp/AsnC family leucine-responsive transcriptional regulator
MISKHKLDVFDLKIIRALTDDGRMSWRDLAAKIGLSFSPTLRRVRHLEKSGTILGYSVQVDQSHLLGTMGVFISVTLERQVKYILIDFEKTVSGLPEVIGGFLMSGSSDYLLHAVVRDFQHYQALLGTLTDTPGVAHIHSSFVIKPFIRRSVPLPEEQGPSAEKRKA